MCKTFIRVGIEAAIIGLATAQGDEYKKINEVGDEGLELFFHGVKVRKFSESLTPCPSPKERGD